MMTPITWFCSPSHRRNLFNSPCHHFVRISFGPPLEDLDKGLDAFERVLYCSVYTQLPPGAHLLFKPLQYNLSAYIL